MRKRSVIRRGRQGTTAVETAMVLPFFFLFLFGLFEIGHVIMVHNMISGACRSAARYGATEDVTTADVANHVRNYLASTLQPDAITISVKDASVYDSDSKLPEDSEDFDKLPDLDVKDAETRQLFLVRAQVNYFDVAILDLPFVRNIQLQAQAFTRHE